ncbi:hypothetical protein AVEN_68975-1 [Araneus ventricosus]|uniref:Uncharacterized protein n=1 Tax=Araneus ventricosus TaxID=182803 RepID=A0A4Y2PAN2_ARAVE|nr:hypothetical protein AVEN_68975-1 [Araneus ventricosus]
MVKRPVGYFTSEHVLVVISCSLAKHPTGYRTAESRSLLSTTQRSSGSTLSKTGHMMRARWRCIPKTKEDKNIPNETEDKEIQPRNLFNVSSLGFNKISYSDGNPNQRSRSDVEDNVLWTYSSSRCTPVENSTLTLDTLKGKIQKIFDPLQSDLCGRDMSRLMHRIPQRIAFLEYFAAQEKLEANTAASDFQFESHTCR